MVKHMRKEEELHVGKHGDHPVGGAVGAAVGAAAGAVAGGAAATGIASAALTGAAAAAPGGPIAMAAGMGIGGVVGALAGKRLSQEINPTTEDAYWQDNYRGRPYVDTTMDYDAYGPAYRYGIDAYTKSEGRPFEDLEPSLRNNWNQSRGKSSLSWDQAKPAAQDAYDRLCGCVPWEVCTDGSRKEPKVD